LATAAACVVPAGATVAAGVYPPRPSVVTVAVGVVVGIKGMRVIAKGNGGRGYHHRLEQQFILFLLPPIPAPSPSATALAWAFFALL
jgi:hypothetical protein